MIRKKKLCTVVLSFVMFLCIVLPHTEAAYASGQQDLLPDNLFYNSTYYNNDLAIACARMSSEIYTNDLSQYFPANQSQHYQWCLDSHVCNYVIGYKTIYINGAPRSLIVIAFRGTNSLYEMILDFAKDVYHYPILGEQALNGPYKFYCSATESLNAFIRDHEEIKNHPIMYLVTGHSLGGAAANLLGADLSRFGTNNVFVYTFNAIKTIANQYGVESGYSNIHNIYNYYDSFGPHGHLAGLGASDPYYKFGHTYFYSYDNEKPEPISYENHNYYVPVVENNRVEVDVQNVAGLLEGGQRWTLTVFPYLPDSRDRTLRFRGNGPLLDMSTYSQNEYFKYDQDITHASIFEGITRIGAHQFYDLINLSSVSIPVSVVEIADYAFEGCNNLSSIHYGGTREQWNAIAVDLSKNECLQNATLFCEGDDSPSEDDPYWSKIVIERGSCGPNLTYILYADGVLDISGSGEMTSHPWTNKCADRISEVHFPIGMTSICSNAFENCISLLGLEVSQNVKSIGHFAFQNSGLTSLTLPEGLETLGYEILAGNTGVKNLTIPGSVTNMQFSTATYYSGADRGTFERSGLESVVIENGVTTISPMAFCYCRSLREVSIPESVTSIGFQAFCGCSALEHITLPDSITRIEYRAFENTGLQELILPANIETIGSRVLNGNMGVTSLFIPNTFSSAPTSERLGDVHSMLYGSSVQTVEFENGIETIPDNTLKDAQTTTAVVLPASVKTIGHFAFQNSGLTSLTLPDGLETLGYEILAGNTGVKSLTIPGSVTNMQFSTATYYSGADRGTFERSGLESVVIENGVTEIGPMAFCYCSSLREVSIPDSVTSIGFQAFCGCSALEHITLPDSITRIEYRAFENTSLQELTLPKQLTSLGSRVLNGNTGVKSLLIPNTFVSAPTGERLGSTYAMLEGSAVERVEFENGIETIPENTIKNLITATEVILPDSVKAIGRQAFYGNTSLITVTLHNGISSIGAEAFSQCGSLKHIDIPDSVTSIGEEAFCSSGLEDLTLPQGIETIGQRFASGTQIKSLSIPNTFKSGSKMLAGSAVEEVIFEEGLITVPSSCLTNAAALVSVTLPSTVKTIEAEAFAGTGISTLVLPDGVETLGYLMINNCQNLKAISIPGSVKTMNYISSSYYSKYGGPFTNPYLEKVVIENGVTSIGTKAFYGDTALTEVVIPNSVVTIGADSFMNCSALKNIDLPDSITSVGEQAFYSSGLEELELPKNIETIGRLFIYGTQIKSLSIPNTFRNSDKILVGSSVEEVVFEEGLITVPSSCLTNAAALVSVTLPSTVKTIEAEAFAGTSITALVLPNGVETLGYLMINNCENLKEIRIPGSVKTMNYISSSYYSKYGGPFTNQYLEKAVIEEGVTAVGTKAFYGDTALTEVVIPNSVVTIGADAFTGCSTDALTIYGYENSYAETYADANNITFTVLQSGKIQPDFVLPSSLTTIGDESFEGCSFVAVKMSDKVTSIGSKAFAYCTALKQIEIPASVTYIAPDTFDGSETVVIYCCLDSEAQRFAGAHNINYVIE